MKTKQEILDDLVIERSSCDSFPEFIKNATIGAIENLVNDAMDTYAIEVAKEAFSKSKDKLEEEYYSFEKVSEIDKESLFSHDNIPEL